MPIKRGDLMSRFGTKTNDSAAAGGIGEVVSSAVAVGAAQAITSNVMKNLTSITLTPGDWDLNACVGIVASNASTSFTYAGGGVGSSAAVIDTELSSTRRTAALVVGGVGAYYDRSDCGAIRASINVATTFYLNALALFTVSTASACGYITARRRR